jgi:polyhydroxyalkanoate synthesis repressor PhaR
MASRTRGRRENRLTHANGNGADEPIIIKKYANRRLYDTSTSAYVTLEHLSTLVRDGKDFIVQDAKTGVDLTRTVLAQIIFEQENRKDGVLPLSFLRQLIQFYGDNFQSMLPAYLELSMQNFTAHQGKWREYMATALGDENKAKAFDDQVRKNMEMFEQTMQFFTPFAPKPMTPPTMPPGPDAEPAPAAANGAEALRALQKQMADMQRQLASLAMPQAPGPDAGKDKG